jgi:uncharacterized SAM-binding protein YcdF (DUF218 family)
MLCVAGPVILSFYSRWILSHMHTFTFVLQKIVWYLFLPPGSLLMMAAAGVIIISRRRRAGYCMIVSSLLLQYLLSLGPTADLILRPLENRYRPLTAEKISADAVVVPGGGSVDMAWLGAEPVPNAETGARLAKGVELAKRFKTKLILTGGNGEPFSMRLADADVMAPAALRMGISPRQLVIEPVSRNTLENSYAVRAIEKGDCIILVTSAYYMRRAVLMFERRGFKVIPAPVYFLTQSHALNASSLIPGAVNLMHSSVGIAEWIGMAWWRVRGEI